MAYLYYTSLVSGAYLQFFYVHVNKSSEVISCNVDKFVYDVLEQTKNC